MQHRLGQSKPLTHPFGVATDGFILTPLQTDQIKKFVFTGRDLRVAHLAQATVEVQGASPGVVSWEDQVLRQVSDLAAGGFAAGWLLQDLGDPLSRVQDPKKDFDQRRFAGSVGTEQSEDFSAANLQRDIL